MTLVWHQGTVPCWNRHARMLTPAGLMRSSVLTCCHSAPRNALQRRQYAALGFSRLLQQQWQQRQVRRVRRSQRQQMLG